MASSLFTPLQLGATLLPNRIIMAPLTRCRAVGGQRLPNALMSDYYVQRASAGLIITEGVCVDPLGVGYPHTPGIWNDAQEAGWRTITERVHRAGGRIFLQLWHVGRVSDPSYLDGALPIAPSALAAPGHVSLLRPKRGYPVPHALKEEEILAVVDAFRRGALRALHAGFDGVEIHGANGYLVDQFLQDGSNKRDDAWGGDVARRAKFLLAVTDAVIGVWGAGRVGMHVAPRSDSHGMGLSQPEQTWTYVAKALGARGLAFICARESFAGPRVGSCLRDAFDGVFVANEGFTPQSAQAALEAGSADAVAFGRSFVANPDLPARFAQGAPLQVPDTATFYTHDAVGYTDYPALP